MPEDTTPEDREDAAAEAIAAWLDEQAERNPALFRVAVARMTGDLPPAGSPASQETVAKVLGISRGTVRRIEARALQLLRSRLHHHLLRRHRCRPRLLPLAGEPP